jgi:hypothetical protein
MFSPPENNSFYRKTILRDGLVLIVFRGAIKRAPLHRAQLRPARACERHASDAPFRGTDFVRSFTFETGGFSWNAKIQCEKLI